MTSGVRSLTAIVDAEQRHEGAEQGATTPVHVAARSASIDALRSTARTSSRSAGSIRTSSAVVGLLGALEHCGAHAGGVWDARGSRAG